MQTNQTDRTHPLREDQESKETDRERERQNGGGVSALRLVEGFAGGGGGGVGFGGVAVGEKLLYAGVLVFVVDIPPHLLDLLAPFVSVAARVHQVVGPVWLKHLQTNKITISTRH